MEIRAVKFRVKDEWRVGGLYRPSHPGSTPAVLMLHGFPGVVQNEDIAAELCRRGISVFLPHFRGSWGSAGRYGLNGLLDDALAAQALLARYHHVDSRLVAVLGYSLGGWVALRLAAVRRVAAVVAMAPAVPAAGGGAAQAQYLRQNARVLNLPDPDAVWAEYQQLARSDHPELYLPKIAPTPLLLVQGLRDGLVPPSATGRLWALAGRGKELLEFAEEGHEFQENRAEVVALVSGWLEARLLRARREGIARLFRCNR